MALVDTTWFTNSIAYAAVTPFAISTAYTVGQIRRQLTTPAVGSERCFIVIVAGTSAASEPTWVLTRGAKTISNTVTFMECTGQAALNGDLVDTQTWAAVKAAAPAVLGQIIKKSTNASYQICTTAGTMGASEPAFSDTAGVTTTETSAVAVWTSLGAVGSYTGGMSPFARLASACASTWFAAGNTVYVSSNHAETQATAITIAPTGSVALFGKFMCHSSAGSYPPASGDLTTGATISTTGTVSTSISPAVAGNYYFRGLTFKSGVGMSTTASILSNAGFCFMSFENCSFELATTGASALITIGAATLDCTTTFTNCTVKFGNVAQSITIQRSYFLWQSTGQVLVSGSSVPATLIKTPDGVSNSIVLEALDLSQISGSLFASNTANAVGGYMVRDCKLHASTTITAPQGFSMVVQLARSSA